MTSAVKIERELNTYIHQLNVDQKKSLLGFIKTILSPKEEEAIWIAQYNKELEEASAAMDRGEFFSNEEVFDTSKKMINAHKKGKVV